MLVSLDILFRGTIHYDKGVLAHFLTAMITFVLEYKNASCNKFIGLIKVLQYSLFSPFCSPCHDTTLKYAASEVSMFIMILSDNLKTLQQLIDVKDVRVSNDYSRKVYQTIEEAKENKMNLSPSPIELSEEMKKGNFLKKS